MNWSRRFLQNDSGATALEYGLIVALISLVIVGTVATVGSDISATLLVVAGNF